jgi:hypothetical protein
MFDIIYQTQCSSLITTLIYITAVLQRLESMVF